MLFTGGFSHIVLDLWTPRGIKVFKPFVDTTYHRSLAVIFIGIWIIASIFAMWHYGTFITLFPSIFTHA
ncbi:metal-dependent hydrolase [Methanosphaera sp.]|uniref:metal-dependent hydrolase n=1 Tax=Methanosphaera sp. TaxID=2666342 RepID=UPI003D92539F